MQHFQISFDHLSKNANTTHNVLVIAAATPGEAVERLRASVLTVTRINSVTPTDAPANNPPAYKPTFDEWGDEEF